MDPSIAEKEQEKIEAMMMVDNSRSETSSETENGSRCCSSENDDVASSTTSTTSTTTISHQSTPSLSSSSSSSASSSSLRSLLEEVLPYPSVISDRGVFWISLSTDENQLVDKLERLVDEDWTTTTTTTTSTTTPSSSSPHENGQKQKQKQTMKHLDSFRIVNTHDISNLRSNKPINKLTDVFDKLSDRTVVNDNGISSSTSSSTNGSGGGIHQLFLKMSLQTESFQRILHNAVRRGLFSSVTLQGDYRNIAMEVRTIQHLLLQTPPTINRGNWYCPVDHEDEGSSSSDSNNNHDFLPHPMDKLSLVCMSLNSDVTTILGNYLDCTNHTPSRPTLPRRRHDRALRTLMLHRTDIENIQALADGLANNDTIEELTISHARLEDDEVYLIVDALRRRLDRQQQQQQQKQQGEGDDVNFTKLTKLSLEGNSIGSRSLQALAGYLNHPRCALEHLNLSHQLSTQPAGAPLPLPPTIKSCLPMFIDELQNCTSSSNNNTSRSSLKTLKLAGNWLTSKDVTATWNCVSSHNLWLRLENLDLSSNRIKSIADLFCNETTESEESRSSTESRSSSCLKRLDLTNNPVWKQTSSDNDTFQREHDAVWNLVETFPHLGYLGVIGTTGGSSSSSSSSERLYTPMLQHALNMNKAGRNLWQPKQQEQEELSYLDAMMPFVLFRSKRIFSGETTGDKNNNVNDINVTEDDVVGREASASVMFDILQHPTVFQYLIN